MTYFSAELVQLIISRSDSELEVQRSRCCYVPVVILNDHAHELFVSAELACRLSFHPLPSPLTTPA